MSIENTNDIVINNTVINNKDGDLDLEKESEIRIYNTWDELDLNPDLLFMVMVLKNRVQFKAKALRLLKKVGILSHKPNLELAKLVVLRLGRFQE